MGLVVGFVSLTTWAGLFIDRQPQELVYDARGWLEVDAAWPGNATHWFAQREPNMREVGWLLLAVGWAVAALEGGLVDRSRAMLTAAGATSAIAQLGASFWSVLFLSVGALAVGAALGTVQQRGSFGQLFGVGARWSSYRWPRAS